MGLNLAIFSNFGHLNPRENYKDEDIDGVTSSLMLLQRLGIELKLEMSGFRFVGKISGKFHREIFFSYNYSINLTVISTIILSDLLRRTFLDWKEKTIHQSHLNKRMELARQHYVSRLKMKVVHAFKLNLHVELRKKV